MNCFTKTLSFRKLSQRAWILFWETTKSHMEPSQMSRVDVTSSVCFPHPGSSVSDHVREVLRNHYAEEVQSDVEGMRFF